MNVNFNAVMEKELQELQSKGLKPKLLLHSCCAPCSSAVIERLKEYFNLTVYYYNPNLDTQEEFDKRVKEQVRICEIFGVGFIDAGYDKTSFNRLAVGLESEKEGGARCAKCFSLRLLQSARVAKELGYEYFTTTLSISPLKDAVKLNAVGESAQNEYGVKFLKADFKKKGGYLRSIELSKEYGLYRQNYCGCEFSKHNQNK